VAEFVEVKNTIEFETTNSNEKKSFPINDIYSIHLFGEIVLNTRFIVFMNQNGIPLHFYNYYGYYSGSYYLREKLLSGFLIVKQVEHCIDLQKRLTIAKEFVHTAIHNISANLEYYKSRIFYLVNLLILSTCGILQINNG
jgi:CRISPR-associated protein Cas1